MASDDENKFFSIIISTRNRPKVFLEALQSVVGQSFANKEIVVVVDGSTEQNLAEYRNIEKQYDGITFHFLTQRPIGHGQSYTINYGVQNSSGRYLCFLDDDDHWTDERYLENTFDGISTAGKTIDVHYSNQKAFHSDGAMQTESVWIEDLIPKVQQTEKNCEDSYFVDVDFLLSSGGFAHLNCSIFRREFYQSLDGMDESIRYENDRDVYIRSLDAANAILFSTRYMSHHNIPDDSKKDNMSTMSSNIEKKLYQLRVYDKGIALSRRHAVVRFCRKAKTYELKHVATTLAENREYKKAIYYAKEVLLNGFNIRWLAYTLYLGFQVLTKPN